VRFSILDVVEVGGGMSGFTTTTSSVRGSRSWHVRVGRRGVTITIAPRWGDGPNVSESYLAQANRTWRPRN